MTEEELTALALKAKKPVIGDKILLHLSQRLPRRRQQKERRQFNERNQQRERKCLQ
jgi:hypothetical protein